MGGQIIYFDTDYNFTNMITASQRKEIPPEIFSCARHKQKFRVVDKATSITSSGAIAMLAERNMRSLIKTNILPIISLKYYEKENLEKIDASLFNSVNSQNSII